MRVRSLLLASFACVTVAVAAAAPASAQELRLRSGKSLDVDAVQVLDRAVRVTMHRDGGTVQLLFPFTRLDAIVFLKTPWAQALTPIQRKRLELLAYLQHLVSEREKARKQKAGDAAEDEEPDEPVPPRPPRPAPRPEPEDADDPPPERPSGTDGRGRTGADERFRGRRPWRRDPPNVPGTERPGRGGSGSGGTPKGGGTGAGAPKGGGSSAGGAAGGGTGGGSGGSGGSGASGSPGVK